jgi:uncharacterized membrane protein
MFLCCPSNGPFGCSVSTLIVKNLIIIIIIITITTIIITTTTTTNSTHRQRSYSKLARYNN